MREGKSCYAHMLHYFIAFRGQLDSLLSIFNQTFWGYHAVHLHQHFGGSTGYGHEEAGGREALDQAFAEIVGAESAIVRAQV